MKSNSKIRFDIKKRLMVYMGLMICVASICISFFTYRNTKTMMVNQVIQNSQDILNVQQSTVYAGVQREILGAHLRTDVKEIYSCLLPENKENKDMIVKANELLDHWQQEEKESLEHIFLVDKNGIIIADSYDELLNANISDRQYTADTLKEGKTIISPVVKSKATGKYTFIVTAPIIQGDTVMGFLGTSVFSDSVTKYFDNMDNNEDQYLFILDPKGNIIYHPNNDKIGQESTTEELREMIKNYNGTNGVKGTLNYTDEKGIKKIAVYESIQEINWLFINTISEDNINAQAFQVARGSIIVGLIVSILGILIAIFLAMKISNPIVKVTGLLKKTQELDLRDDSEYIKLAKSNDEIGDIAKATLDTRGILRRMVEELNGITETMVQGANLLSEVSVKLNDSAGDNSATTEELSAGMEETAATTEEVSATTEEVSSSVENMTQSIDNGLNISKNIKGSAENVKKESKESLEKSLNIYEKVKKNMRKALDDTNKVKEIENLTSDILQITEQTNLLALNASIEAARAGEAGKGFAVVATEVGKLAEQSSKTGETIQEVVQGVLIAVENMKNNASEMLKFMDAEINSNYKTMDTVSNQYLEDAEKIRELMESVNDESKVIKEAISNINVAINEVAINVSENSRGILNITEKTGEIVEQSDKMQGMSNENKQVSAKVESLVSKFKVK